LRNTLIKFGKHLFFGLLIILGGLFLYITIALAIGYLPYSDRPGPGWYKNQYGISFDDIRYVWGFILFLGIYILALLIIAYFVFRLFLFVGYNRIVFSIFGGLFIGFFSMYLTLGIGWYIAIDNSTTIAGGILGIIYGATLFPKFLKPQKEI
jgi:hypothetical protein